MQWCIRCVGVELCANVTACHRYLLECSLQHCKLHQSRNKTGLPQTGRGCSIGLSRRHSGAVTNRPRRGILAKRPAGPSLAAAAPMPYNRDIMNRERKLVAFIGLHPELHEALGLSMSDHKTCEAVYSRESALLRREMPEFARRRLEVHEPGAALSG